MHPIMSARIAEIRSSDLLETAARERHLSTTRPDATGPVRRWLANAAVGTARRLDPALRT